MHGVGFATADSARELMTGPKSWFNYCPRGDSASGIDGGLSVS